MAASDVSVSVAGTPNSISVPAGTGNSISVSNANDLKLSVTNAFTSSVSVGSSAASSLSVASDARPNITTSNDIFNISVAAASSGSNFTRLRQLTDVVGNPQNNQILVFNAATDNFEFSDQSGTDTGGSGTDPVFLSVSVRNSSPKLSFRNNNNDTTPNGTVLATIEANGISSEGGGKVVPGAKIEFAQSNVAGADAVPASLKFFTSSSTDGQQLALTLSEEKTLIFAGHAQAPSAQSGGMYYNTTNKNFYLGVG